MVAPLRHFWYYVNSTVFHMQPPGDTKSGDNDALKHLLGEMSAAERARRVAVPPQCAMNSYLWRPSVRQWSRWFSSSSKVRSGIWRPGHLLVHLAGWDNYKVCAQCTRTLNLPCMCLVSSLGTRSGAVSQLWFWVSCSVCNLLSMLYPAWLR